MFYYVYTTTIPNTSVLVYLFMQFHGKISLIPFGRYVRFFKTAWIHKGWTETERSIYHFAIEDLPRYVRKVIFLSL